MTYKDRYPEETREPRRPPKYGSDRETGGEQIEISRITSADELALLQCAGKKVGLPIKQVTEVLDGTGKVIPLKEGEVAYRLQTGSADLFEQFTAKVAELRAARQAAST